MQTVAGGVILLGSVGCSASAQTGVPSASSSVTAPAATPAASMARQDIRVEIDPKKIAGGATKNIRIRALCPLPTGGTEYRATARSDAFTGLVTLVPPSSTTAETDTSSPASAVVPEVRGTAALRADAKPGGYKVQVRCEATNDIGSGTFKVTAGPSAGPKPSDKPGDKPTAKPTPSKIPTKAPHAGGGGTAAGGPEEGSGPPAGVTVLVLLAAAGGAVIVARRRSGA
jgi:hypothetical protein